VVLQRDRQAPQYQLRSRSEDEKLLSSVMSKVLDNPVKLDAREVFAISPEIRKRTVDILKTSKVATGYAAEETTDVQMVNSLSADSMQPEYAVPSREIDVTLPGGIIARGVVDSGSDIVAISPELLHRFKPPVNTNIRFGMTGAGGHKSRLPGCAEDIPLKFGSIIIPVHAHIVPNSPYDLLLGRPFIKMADLASEHGGDSFVIRDPNNYDHCLNLASYPHLSNKLPQDPPLPFAHWQNGDEFFLGSSQ
jgi:hypothetical protein